MDEAPIRNYQDALPPEITDEYIIDSKIGEGTFGDVYKGFVRMPLEPQERTKDEQNEIPSAISEQTEDNRGSDSLLANQSLSLAPTA